MSKDIHLSVVPSLPSEDLATTKGVNLNGQIVMERKLYAKSTSVPVNSLNSGIYFAIIRNNGYEDYRMKVFL